MVTTTTAQNARRASTVPSLSAREGPAPPPLFTSSEQLKSSLSEVNAFGGGHFGAIYSSAFESEFLETKQT